MENEKLRKLFERKAKIANENSILSVKLDKEIEKYLGFEIPEFSLEFAVDTLNEGYGSLSFEDFILELNKIKNKK